MIAHLLPPSHCDLDESENHIIGYNEALWWIIVDQPAMVWGRDSRRSTAADDFLVSWLEMSPILRSDRGLYNP